MPTGRLERSPDQRFRCTFCRRTEVEVGRIVLGPTPDVGICRDCAALAAEIFAEEDAGKAPA